MRVRCIADIARFAIGGPYRVLVVGTGAAGEVVRT
jgi:hypothetical protein